jgi:prepilin-type N-terminal cleavage/methylation domain-containing protein
MSVYRSNPRTATGRKGLTLFELLMASVLMGLVAAVVLPRLITGGGNTKSKSCEALRRDIEIKVQLWRRNFGTWPAADLSDIGADQQYFPEGLPTCPVDGSAFGIDPATQHVTGHSH